MADISSAPQEQQSYGWLVVLGVLVLLLGLPVAAWLDMRERTRRLLEQALAAIDMKTKARPGTA